MKSHPRLFASTEKLDGLKKKPRHAFLAAAHDHVGRQAREFVKSADYNELSNTHNAHLGRARTMQGRVFVLLARWLQTGQEKFRKAVLGHVRTMKNWEYWSWIAWRQGQARPDDIFDLSYGENSYTLALAYDLLFDTLSAGEKKLFITMARERSLKPFLANTGDKRGSFWFKKPDTNWNTVCAGGAGMLALTMYEDIPEAREALRRAEESVKPFFSSVKESGGAWPEGIGYWNYGMAYGFTYLLSHERATGRKHPLLKIPEIKKTLWFPLDFCPNGVPSSFGDVNKWGPQPFHYAMAQRLKMPDLVQALDQCADRNGFEYGRRDKALEYLLMHPETSGRKRAAMKNVVKLYKGQDWGFLADRMPAPRIYMSVRGGTTEVPHGHMDLMSYQVVVNKEALVNNIGVQEYLDTAFSPRRYELFETTPPAKNTILINGVGIMRPSEVKTKAVKQGSIQGLRIDASNAMGVMRDGPAVKFCSRLYLMLRGRAFLIIDRVDLTAFGRIDSRLHTYAAVSAQKAGAGLKGTVEKLRIAYAGTVPCSCYTAVDAPTTPGPGANMLRWCTDHLNRSATMATLLVPGGKPAKVSLEEKGKQIIAVVKADGLNMKVKLSNRLNLVK